MVPLFVFIVSKILVFYFLHRCLLAPILIVLSGKLLEWWVLSNVHANFSNISTLRSLYVTHVRSHLEYCSVIWSPWQVTQIDKIERVQQKFIKFLCFKSNVQYTSTDYDSLCARFKLPPLVRRRKFLDAIFVYKLVNSRYNCPSILYKVCFNVQSRQLRNNHIFRISASRVNLRKYSPILRCLTTCNDVFKANPNIDLFSPVSAFRRVLQAACF